ncbi:hypothetical protein [Azospirillum sp. sgz302134]
MTEIPKADQDTLISAGEALRRLRRVLPSYAFAWEWLWGAMRSPETKVMFTAERQVIIYPEYGGVADDIVFSCEGMEFWPLREGYDPAIYPFINNGELEVYTYTSGEALGSAFSECEAVKLVTFNFRFSARDIARWCGDNDDLTGVSIRLEQAAAAAKCAPIGRPPPRFMVNALVHLIAWAEANNGLPETQAELAQKLAEWFTANGHEEPSNSTLREYAKQIMKEVERCKSAI